MGVEHPSGRVFRGYTPCDLLAMVALDNLCFTTPFRFTRSIMQRLAESPDAVTTLVFDNTILVGFAIVELEHNRESKFGYIMTLDVHPEFRRSGIARELLRHMENAARNRGATEMLLHVWIENKPAIRLYASSGYRQVLHEKDFYDDGLDGFLFAKQLK